MIGECPVESDETQILGSANPKQQAVEWILCERFWLDVNQYMQIMNLEQPVAQVFDQFGRLAQIKEQRELAKSELDRQLP
ncbi:hypothetical protein BH10PSE7_BH10PSE7_22480 [soil metagenome]